MKNAGVTPNAVTFSTLIDKASTTERAEHWYAEMKNAGVTPDEFTLKILRKKGISAKHAP